MAGKDGCPLLMDRNHESKTKKVDGEAHPASDFAYVPDPEKPSTWKLPIFNMRHVGGALAAMTSDYRGNPVEIPEGDRRAVMNRKKADSVFFHFFFSACKQEGKKYLFPSFPGLSRLGTG